MRKKRPQVGLAGIGLELTAAVIGGLLLGLWIDRHYGTSPWAAVTGGTVGIVGGLLNFVRQARRAMENATGGTGDGASRKGGED